MLARSDKTRLLRALSDRKGIKLWLCELLSDGPKTLNELYGVIREEYDLTRVAIENHIRNLQEDGIVFQEDRYQEWYLTCPYETKEFLEFLNRKSERIISAAESNRVSYMSYERFILESRDKERKAQKNRLDSNLDNLFNVAFCFFNPKLKKTWMQRAIRHEVAYDFGRLKDQNADAVSTR